MILIWVYHLFAVSAMDNMISKSQMAFFIINYIFERRCILEIIY